MRDDAILVVTFITDEEDTDSTGNAAEWFQRVVDAKGGDVESIVMLGLFGDYDLPQPICEGSLAEDAPKLVEFMGSFGERGLRGSVCAEDYAPFFTEAIDLIDQTCSEFVPEG